ncbi:NifB/NifX family molybdenum-iron cluster-binding protein [Klebsiella michiganensis]|uniref:NifB/NifX family molybdenum-iron cluster-binding protein n=1 Tax=Klebsiella michiganensis TaxID=1134687 RepID=UPI000D7D58A2|nr:nitrogen fixation protein NifY [Klebsiella michiganensis]
MPDNDTLFWRMLALFQSLPDLQPAQIVDWLAQESGETLTPARLATLTQPQLAASFPSATAVMSPARWSRVMASLQGALPAHLRIVRPAQRTPQLLAAFCSQDGLVINGHFGQGRLFFIYAFDEQGGWLHDLRRYPSSAHQQEANEVRARLIEDCQLLFCQEIGGPAAARLIRHRIHPMKAQPGTTIQAQCEAINTLLAGRLPPWLAKRLNRDNPLEERVF